MENIAVVDKVTVGSEQPGAKERRSNQAPCFLGFYIHHNNVEAPRRGRWQMVSCRGVILI